MQNENVAMSINRRKQQLQTTVISQWTAPKLGAAEQGSQNSHFQLLEGRTEKTRKTETESPGSQHCMEKGITAAGHVAVWEN